MRNAMNSEEVERVLPHADRMVLVDRVITMDASTIHCRGKNPTDPRHPLREGAILPIVAGIEYAAQAAALHAIVTDQARGPARGQLVILQDVSWTTDRLDVSTEIDIHAEEIARVANGLHYRFVLSSTECELISGRLMIAITPLESGNDPQEGPSLDDKS